MQSKKIKLARIRKIKGLAQADLSGKAAPSHHLKSTTSLLFLKRTHQEQMSPGTHEALSPDSLITVFSPVSDPWLHPFSPSSLPVLFEDRGFLNFRFSPDSRLCSPCPSFGIPLRFRGEAPPAWNLTGISSVSQQRGGRIPTPTLGTAIEDNYLLQNVF